LQGNQDQATRLVGETALDPAGLVQARQHGREMLASAAALAAPLFRPAEVKDDLTATAAGHALPSR
jgi:hypothetical protein